MKKENKILLVLILFCLFTVLVIESASKTSLFRDPYMFRHLDAAEFILEKERINVFSEEETAENFTGFQIFNEKITFSPAGIIYLFSDKPVFFFVPVLSASIFSLLSGLDIFFLFNHFFFLIFISGLCFFILFRELFKDNKLALGLSLIAVLFPFETLYYKISLHGWHFLRIFSSLNLFFLIKLLRQGFSFKSKHFFLLVIFSVLGVYSDKSGFALVLIPVFFFFILFFFFQRKQLSSSKKSLNLFFVILFFILLFSFQSLFYDIFRIFQAISYNFFNLNFLPSFISLNVPFSEFYLKKDFLYSLLRYFIPVLTVFAFLLLNFRKIKDFFFDSPVKKSFLFSQILFYVFVAVPLLFSFYFSSSSAGTWIFFFLSIICFIGLAKMKKSKIQYYLIAFFFIFVLIIPFLFFTQTPQFKYEQFNEKHVASIDWVQGNLNSDSIVYSDVKMAKTVSLKTDIIAVNPAHEFNLLMKNYILPVYYEKGTEKVLQFFKPLNISHLLLTEEMSSLMVQPANELLMPATELSKFDSSENFDKIFENKQARLYKINYE